MSARSNKRRPIALPGLEGEPASESATSHESEWVAEGTPGRSVFQDPSNPARYHRKGRGGKPKRTVRRITVYIADDLATALDVHLAKSARPLSRSDVVDAALRSFLDTSSE